MTWRNSNLWIEVTTTESTCVRYFSSRCGFVSREVGTEFDDIFYV